MKRANAKINESSCYDKSLSNCIKQKKNKKERLKTIKDNLLESFSEEELEEKEKEILVIFHKNEKEANRDFILNEQKELDEEKQMKLGLFGAK